jgi:hydrogenase-4 transcriptional activator
VDVRVVAATNRDLSTEIEAGRFRRDLFYRLCVFPMHMPPLRERGTDVSLLAEHFLGLAARRLHRPDLRLTDEGHALLMAYDWPGNIRELHHVIERGTILTPRGPLRIERVLGENLEKPKTDEFRETPDVRERPILSEEELQGQERENILAALEKTRWRVYGAGGAAAILGLKPTTLASRLKRFGIQRPR